MVETVVFMTLALFVLGGLFATAQQASRIDALSEERLAAIFACETILEEYRNMKFENLPPPGFNKTRNGRYQKRQANYFYKRNNPKAPEDLKKGRTYGRQIVTLIPRTSGDIPCYQVQVLIRWDTRGGSYKDPAVSEIVTAMLYPNCAK